MPIDPSSDLQQMLLYMEVSATRSSWAASSTESLDANAFKRQTRVGHASQKLLFIGNTGKVSADANTVAEVFAVLGYHEAGQAFVNVINATFVEEDPTKLEGEILEKAAPKGVIAA